MSSFGRKKITTDVKDVNDSNVVAILNAALPTHTENANDTKKTVQVL